MNLPLSYPLLPAGWARRIDVLEIPRQERDKYPKGEEARRIWDWLEARDEMSALPAALESTAVDRADLARTLRANGRAVSRGAPVALKDDKHIAPARCAVSDEIRLEFRSD